MGTCACQTRREEPEMHEVVARNQDDLTTVEIIVDNAMKVQLARYEKEAKTIKKIRFILPVITVTDETNNQYLIYYPDKDDILEKPLTLKNLATEPLVEEPDLSQFQVSSMDSRPSTSQDGKGDSFKPMKFSSSSKESFKKETSSISQKETSLSDDVFLSDEPSKKTVQESKKEGFTARPRLPASSSQQVIVQHQLHKSDSS